MSVKQDAIVLALMAMIMSPATAWAFGGGAGCADLPDYARATGVLEGIPSGCDMSVEQARRIVAAHDGQSVVDQPVAPRHAHRKHHRARTPGT